MLHVEYEVKTKQGPHETLHVPDPIIENIPGNIMMIEGPNSSGKSTLMNLIAIGCGGEDDQSLSPTMRSNLKELTQSSYRNISFDITLNDPKTGRRIQLVRTPGSNNNIVLDGDEEISPQQFKQRFNLIYDIPEDPTARLKNITKTIVDDHRIIKDRIQDFGEYIRTIKMNLEDVKTKSEIEAIRMEVQKAKVELKQFEEQLPDPERIIKLNILKKIRLYRDLDIEIGKKEDKLAFEKGKPEQKKEIRHNTRQIDQYINSIDDLEPMLKDELHHIDDANLIESYENLFDKWVIMTKTNPLDHKSLLKEYLVSVNHIRRMIPNIDEERRHVARIDEVIKALNELDNSETVGGLGTVSEIVNKLIEHKNSIANANAINVYSKIKNELLTIGNLLPKIQQQQSKLTAIPTSNGTASTPVTNYRDQDVINKITADINRLKDDQRDVLIQLKNDGVNLSEYSAILQQLCHELSVSTTFSKELIEELLQQESKKNGGVEKEIRKLRKYIDTNEVIISDYENNPQPPFADDKNKIIAISNRIRTIRAKIGAADDRLKDIEEQNTETYISDPKLFNPLWEYIGSRLGIVRDKGNEYRVMSVDLLIEPKGLIITEDGTEIHIGAMGTGEGQLSYIRGLLSSDNDRMIIALFDEVGNMSNATISYVTNRLRELQECGKLMVGIMVRPGDSMVVTTYGL